jgi:hypothetical protein
MFKRAASLVLFSVILAQAALTAAEPIIKPKKYHGPIPRRSFTLRAGFLGGPENQEMIEALDRYIKPPEEAFSEDFDNAFIVDGTYTYKLHPQFAARLSGSAAFLRTSSVGTFVPDVVDLPDSVLAPQLDYTRDFDVDLFVVEASALYYFADSAIQEFQPYLGGGFSFGVPHAKFKEVRIDYDTGEVFEEIDRDEWSFEPGVHGFVGASYYISNLWAVNVEGRGQIMQSRFPVNVPDLANDTIEEVDVIVDYSGFLIGVGITRAF